MEQLLTAVYYLAVHNEMLNYSPSFRKGQLKFKFIYASVDDTEIVHNYIRTLW